MIKVGFLLNFPVTYKGGINYLKNLFYAIKEYHSSDIELILFVPTNLDKEYIQTFERYVKIIRTNILQRKTILWFISRVFDKLFKFDPLITYLFYKYNISVVSHSGYVHPFKSIKSINWVPDFQYHHYPTLWTSRQLELEYKTHKHWIDKSDRVIVSSYDALNDLLNIYPVKKEKVSVLHFVSQPDMQTLKLNEIWHNPYSNSQFFYLPNQFWEHKNHIVVFKAIKILKDKGIEITLLVSGLMEDFRNKNSHMSKLIAYINSNHLENNINLLGLIPYNHVLNLIKNSIAVINPSFFEGWSSTVEESKSCGKKIVLSDIPVHREQNPQFGYFFDPKSETELADILELLIAESQDPNIPSREVLDLELTLLNRTKVFADAYRQILTEVVQMPFTKN